MLPPHLVYRDEHLTACIAHGDAGSGLFVAPPFLRGLQPTPKGLKGVPWGEERDVRIP